MFRRFHDSIYSRFILLTRRLSDRQVMIGLAIAVGLIAGFGTYVFESLLHFIRNVLLSRLPVDEAGYLFLVYPAAGIVLASLFVRYVIKDDISEGVTKVLYAMSRKSSRIRGHNCYSSVVGGAMTIGFGGSVGPEAPIVLTGAAIGSGVGRLARLNYKNTTLLLCCGAGAALSAIFKAPITGVVFVLEILMLDITVSSVIPLLIATVSATVLSFVLNGFDPLVAVNVEGFRIGNIPMYILLGALCGVFSYYFTSMNARVGERFGRLRTQSGKWIAGGILIGILIFIFPPLYGEGYEAFTSLMHNDTATLFDNSLFYRYSSIPWVVIAYLASIMFFKVIAMAATNAAGGVGGTFAPSLFVGAFMGAIVAYTCNLLFGMQLPMTNFTLVGMAGVMAGVMNAPLTSIFLIAEISNGYALFVPLMIVSSISFAISYWLDSDSIYTKKLRKKGELLTHDKDQSVLVFLQLDKLMETDFHRVATSTTLGDVVQLISTARRNIFPVVDADDKLLGVVQLDDLRADLFDRTKYSTPISHYMIQPPDRIQPNEQILSVLKRFEDNKTWMLPVVDKTNTYLGFISKSRILAAYREQLVAISQ